MSAVTRRSVEISMRRMALAARRGGGWRVRADDLHLAAFAQAALANGDDALVALESLEDLDHGAVGETGADGAPPAMTATMCAPKRAKIAPKRKDSEPVAFRRRASAYHVTA